MQANGEISLLHLTNDRLNCSGLFLRGLLGLLYEGRHLSLSVWQKITINVFYSTFTHVFLFLSRFFTFLTFFIFGGAFFHL